MAAGVIRAESDPQDGTSAANSHRPSDRVRKKMENYGEIFSNIMRKKVMIIQKLIKLFPWLLQRYKIHANVFPSILTPS